MSSAFNIPDNDAPALPLHQQFKDAFRATGYVTNGQAWELADAAMTVHRKALAAAPTPPVDAVPGEPVATFEDWWYGHDGVRQRRVGYLGWPCTKELAESIWSGAREQAPSSLAVTLQKAREALAYHQEQTRPIDKTADAIKAIDASLAASVASRAGSEPVAWRWRYDSAKRWVLTEKPMNPGDEYEVQPLYAVAPAAAAEPMRAPMTRIAGVNAEVLTRAALANPVPPLPDRERAASLGVGEDTKRLDWERELIAAAQAVIERWDTPLWKDAPHTAIFINRMREAIDAARASAGEAQS